MMKQRERQIWDATKNRRELVAAQLTRRDLFKMGLLTSTGYLVSKCGLSARASGGNPESPPTTPFVEPLPIMPIKEPVSLLNPPSQVAPNTEIIVGPDGTGIEREGRSRDHQGFGLCPPVKFYEIHQMETTLSVHPELPLQTMWGFDGHVPGPTYVAYYGEPILVRNFNSLPPAAQNGGFGLPSVTTHLHNGHTPSESDGFTCDFYERGQFYDQHYPNVLAGFTDPQFAETYGDPREAMSTLWYHDHRVHFTAQNVYKGCAGFYLLFNSWGDTGDESTGFHLPHFPDYDIPLFLADRVFDRETGLLFFDLFNLDGILGDKFLVNGKIQPFFVVEPRRYRFRCLNGGPSRFYQIFLTELDAGAQGGGGKGGGKGGGGGGKGGAKKGDAITHPFWHIANDGNLLPRPIQVQSFTIGVAERMDIIIDFRPFAGKTLYLENLLEQKDGRGPSGDLLPAGRGNLLLQFRVRSGTVEDASADPASIEYFYDLPDLPNLNDCVTRTFRFERQNGQWAINQRLMDCEPPRFRIRKNSCERWILQNNSGGWQHPIHIHFEEFRLLTRNGLPVTGVEIARKDVVRLRFNEQIELVMRFRDFEGRFPLHCHNTVHEDHAMMLRWDVVDDDTADTNPRP